MPLWKTMCLTCVKEEEMLRRLTATVNGQNQLEHGARKEQVGAGHNCFITASFKELKDVT